jgi:hypothetical protein
LLISTVAAALAFVGPGAYSLDAVDGLGLAGWVPGGVAVVAGLVAAGGSLATRRPAPVAPQS